MRQSKDAHKCPGLTPLETLPAPSASVKHRAGHLACTWELRDSTMLPHSGKIYDAAFANKNTKQPSNIGSLSVSTKKSTKHSKMLRINIIFHHHLHITYNSEFRDKKNNIPKY